ncbi:LuxR C-terminal-related transcriptional regulator [Chryseobacterium indologenes]|uniref:LuxR C-terminal-related transcriptional regulator n=1 Tax=Chryseobacterium indologenes TaxID=253 RepID=UPI001628E56B|nr:LuxR C-terminal-related transcriptional regulator [Chryseobacterium indologenes]
MNCINDTFLKNCKILVLLFIAISLCSCNKKVDINEINTALSKKNEKLRLEGKDTELIALNNKIIKQSKESGYQKGMAWGYINLANMYGTMGRYKVSHNYLKSAMAIIKNLDDDFLYAKLYHEYGQLNYVTGLARTALSYNAKAIYYEKKLHNKGWLLGNMYMQRAEFIDQTNKDSVLIYFHKGFDADPSAINSSLLGNYHLWQSKNMDSAVLYTNNALKLLKKSEYGTVRQGIVYSFYATLLFEKKDYEMALGFYKKAADILVKTKRVNKLPGLYQQIALTYGKLNNKERESEYFAKAEQLRKTLEQSGTEAIDLSLTEAIEQKDNDDLSIIFIGIGTIILIISISVFLYIKNKKHKKVNISLLQENSLESLTKEKISKENFTELLDLAKSNDAKFIKRFEEVNPGLFLSLLKINSQLTKSELSLCAMIWLGFSSKDIADYTFIQHRSVQTKKGRLRKKLHISSETDLYSFFTSL